MKRPLLPPIHRGRLAQALLLSAAVLTAVLIENNVEYVQALRVLQHGPAGDGITGLSLTARAAVAGALLVLATLSSLHIQALRAASTRIVSAALLGVLLSAAAIQVTQAPSTVRLFMLTQHHVLDQTIGLPAKYSFEPEVTVPVTAVRVNPRTGKSVEDQTRTHTYGSPVITLWALINLHLALAFLCALPALRSLERRAL